MTSTFTAMEQRSDRILSALQSGQVGPQSDAIRELAELSIALEDAPVKPVVVARLTVTRALGNRTIIEVWDTATFHSFYRIFTQEGRRRSTKKLVRAAWRNEGIRFLGICQLQPGLETLAENWRKHPGVTAVTVRIIKKRAYRKLLNARPDQLGLTTTSVNIPAQRFSSLRPLPVQLRAVKEVAA